MTAYWLLKSDPDAYSWQRMTADRRTRWEGVRNYQASNNLKAIRRGERAFFYHSGALPAVVGIVEVVRECYPDPSDESGRFGMVDVKWARPLKTPVPLAAIKATPALKGIALLRQGRLSVVPVDAEAWALICRLGGVEP